MGSKMLAGPLELGRILGVEANADNSMLDRTLVRGVHFAVLPAVGSPCSLLERGPK
jgi:hypothetical protein